MARIIQDWHNQRVTATFNGKQCKFRSKFEYRFARYLEGLQKIGAIKEWDYEPKTFWFDGIKRGTCSYMPDFFVIEKDGTEIYYETKMHLVAKDITKFKRMAKYHPGVNLVLMMHDNRKREANNMRLAAKYVARVTFARPLFTKWGIK